MTQRGWSSNLATLLYTTFLAGVRKCNLQSIGYFSRVPKNMIDYYVFNEQVRHFEHMLVTHFACLIKTRS